MQPLKLEKNRKNVNKMQFMHFDTNINLYLEADFLCLIKIITLITLIQQVVLQK